MTGLPPAIGSCYDSFVSQEQTQAWTVVTASGNVADSDNVMHYGKVVGITQTPIASGFAGVVVFAGEIINPDWHWKPKSLLFLNGRKISDVPPGRGFCQIIGLVKAPTTVIVKIGEPLLL